MLPLPHPASFSEGHRLRERQEALDTVRGRQELAISQEDVRDVSIRFAAYRSPEGTNASFVSVGFTSTGGWWMI